MKFDYVIVGGGSAGCVLANRLTEDASVTVLLLEAGCVDRSPLIHIPLGMGKIHELKLFDWGYHTEPEPHLNNRSIDAARGKVLGGSSSINVMAYTRGHRGDYDRWARNGATGWSYDECLPYFKRSETWTGSASEWRGNSGPLGTEFARTTDPLFGAWTEAFSQAGFPVVEDYNGHQGVGVGRSQYTIRNGRRSSTATAYLKPARHRTNLCIETGALTTSILFEGRRASGVAYLRGKEQKTVAAEREVILSAGTFNSPQLLMLSGIGPADHLSALGIPTIMNLPVGENLQDHLAVMIEFARSEDVSPFRDSMRLDKMAVAMVQAYLTGRGRATVVPGGLHAFIKTVPDLDVPDIEFMFRGLPKDARLWFPGIRRAYQDGFGIRPCLLHPESRGKVSLRSRDPSDPPRILFNLLSEANDLRRLITGFKVAREVASQQAMAPYRGSETSPGIIVKTDSDIENFIRRTAITAHHPAGTCKMGSASDGVLDPEFRVRGIESLRVVDASAMPDLVGAHINACVIMMAERAADMIAGRSIQPQEH